MKVLILFICLASIFGLSVYDIQYSVDGPSPYLGEIVEVSGIVTATGFDGDKWFISDASGGPWSGVYVFDYEHTVSRGDFVTITCEVEEFYDLTELKNITTFVSEGGYDIPPAYPVDCEQANTEPFEGVLVTLTDVTIDSVISPGQWYISDGTATLKVANHFDYEFGFESGDVIPSITGVMNYSWDTFTLEPRFEDDFTAIVENKIPEQISVFAYPNPFNSALAFSTPQNSQIEIYDLNGNKIASPLKNIWTPKENITSGIYLAKITSGNSTTLKKVSFVR